MIQILGLKRVLTLFGLTVVCALLGTYVYLYALPKHEKYERTVRDLRSQVVTRQDEVSQLKLELEQLVNRKNDYEKLREQGFFLTQDRVLVREKINEVQRLSGVLSAKYSVDAAHCEYTNDLDVIDYVLLNSPVKITIEALDDRDVYKFVNFIDSMFPGYVKKESLVMAKTGPVNSAILKNIGSGNPQALIKADLIFSWYTMVPRNNVDCNAASQESDT